MVKLVHKTEGFGAISLEYLHEAITVGSAPDNELVLPHPSVRPHHCQIILQEESLVMYSVGDLPGAVQGEGRVYKLGEQLMIGDLLFEVEHSVNTTLAIPPAAIAPPEQRKPDPTGKTYKCERCHEFFFSSAVHVIGIVGGKKHLLCPKCSEHVTRIAPPPPPPPHGVIGTLQKYLKDAARWSWRKINER